jgi:hypothetical protein
MDELVLFLVFFAIVGLVTALFRVFKPKRISLLSEFQMKKQTGIGGE